MPEEPAPTLIGREPEVARLTRFVEDLHEGSGAAVLVRGEPGIGKTALWRHGIASAEGAGVRVLSTRCVESEMPIAACALADLVGGCFADVADELPAAQGEALASALGLEATAATGPDRVTLPRAVCTTLRLLSQGAPLLIAIDDAQWLDPSSRRLIAFAARRLTDRPVGVLLTIRGRSGEADPLALVGSYGSSRFEELDLGPLSAGALGHLLRSNLEVHLPRPLLKRVHDASGGNPMYALELARSLGGGIDIGSLVQLPLPASLQKLVQERVQRLPAELGPLLEIAAVLDRPSVSLIRRTMGDADAAERRLDAAVSAEVLVVESDGAVRFTHPLLASAVYGGIPPGRRRKLHERLAATLEDLEERAVHLALAATEPDSGVADQLEAAARHAAARGAPDAAATLVEQARRLTPHDDAIQRAERGLVAAEYLAESCEFSRARVTVEDLLAGDLDDITRARTLQLLYVFSPPPAFREGTALLEHAVEHARGDRSLHVRLLAWLAHAQGSAGDYVAAEALGWQAVEFAEELDDPQLSAFAATCLFDITRVRGSPRPAAFDRLLAIERAGHLAGEPAPGVIVGRERCSAGDLESARALLEREVTACEARGEELTRAGVVLYLSDVERRAGNWDLASRYLAEALAVQIDGENFFGEAVARSAQALLSAHRGEVAEARALATDAIARGEEWGWEEFVARNRWVLGFVELSLGEPRRAWSQLEGLPETLERIGIGEPGHCPLLPDVIETLAALGRFDEAGRVLTGFEAQAEALEHRWATPAALRCRAILELGGGDAEKALEAAEQAAARFEEVGHPFDRGRALLTSGDALRRLGRRRRAAERLDAAREVFEGLGARLWLKRAEREHHRAAPRARRADELTAAERQVAALVVNGRTNRETAAELFTTVSTVEAHLTRIYRKLEVRSRTELARRAADQDLDPS